MKIQSGFLALLLTFSIFPYSLSMKKVRIENYCSSFTEFDNFLFEEKERSLVILKTYFDFSLKNQNQSASVYIKSLDQNPLGANMYPLKEKRLFHVTAKNRTIFHFFKMKINKNSSPDKIKKSMKKIATVKMKLQDGWESKSNKFCLWKKDINTFKPWQTLLLYHWEASEENGKLPELVQHLKFSETCTPTSDDPVIATRIIKIPEK